MLDPFAGSGALFLEALSRGAREGLALDTNGEAVAALRNHLDALKCGTAQLVLGDAVRYLGNQAPSAFDLVFLDPPFHQNLLQDACRLLETRGWLNPDAWIYTESESVPRPSAARKLAAAPEKKAGNVHYALWQRGAWRMSPASLTSPTPAGAGEPCAAQSAADWRAISPARRAGAFLPRGRPLDCTLESAGNPFFLPSWPASGSAQAGYRWHGISGERLSGWQDDWLVVADQGADPFILETGSGRILFDLHGGRGLGPGPVLRRPCGRWRPAWPASARSGAAPARTSCWTTAASRPAIGNSSSTNCNRSSVRPAGGGPRRRVRLVSW